MGVLLAFPSGSQISENLQMLPRCVICGNPIQDEYCYCIQPGAVCCEKCMNKNFRISTKQLMED